MLVVAPISTPLATSVVSVAKAADKPALELKQKQRKSKVKILSPSGKKPTMQNKPPEKYDDRKVVGDNSDGGAAIATLTDKKVSGSRNKRSISNSEKNGSSKPLPAVGVPQKKEDTKEAKTARVDAGIEESTSGAELEQNTQGVSKPYKILPVLQKPGNMPCSVPQSRKQVEPEILPLMLVNNLPYDGPRVKLEPSDELVTTQEIEETNCLCKEGGPMCEKCSRAQYRD